MLKLKGLSRDMRAASKLMQEVYGKNSNAPELKGAAKLIDSWILEIKKEIENDK